ncbi:MULTISPECIES: hypothetical protein [Bacillaceae]|nr:MULTISPECIES: hypothetical protein [Bacillaceae]MDX8363205.1 hypothetical protein [Cytobacillus sp. IB215316]
MTFNAFTPLMGLFIYLLFIVIGANILYWVIKLAVKNAINESKINK